jgi:hypothetical protein
MVHIEVRQIPVKNPGRDEPPQGLTSAPRAGDIQESDVGELARSVLSELDFIRMQVFRFASALCN